MADAESRGTDSTTVVEGDWDVGCVRESIYFEWDGDIIG